MHLELVYLTFIVANGFCARERPYTDFKVVEIVSQTAKAMRNIKNKLHNVHHLHRGRSENTLVLIVSPGAMTRVLNTVAEEHALMKILKDNLQHSVDEEFRQMDARRRKRAPPTLEDDLQEYLSLEEIYEFQERVVSTCINLTNVERKTIGYSAHNNPITVLQISNNDTASNKTTVFIEAGIHAREWLSPAAANYIVYQLACNTVNADMLDLFNWEVISVLNPDGYQYTHSGHRYWRNNRQNNSGTDCVGTDINRNFEIGFGRKDGSSSDMCDENYSGAFPYSTPEAKALKDYIIDRNDTIVSYVALHTFGQFILLPWSYKGGIPSDYDNLKSLAKTAEKAMGLPFEIGTGFSLIYPAAGTSHDFAREKAGIALTYTWELMPDMDHAFNGFSPGRDLLPEYNPAIWRGIRGYVLAVANQTGGL